MDYIAKLALQFEIEGSVKGVSPIGNGHINDTYKVTMSGAADAPDYILQRVNHYIFKDIGLLQNNIKTITDHIRNKLCAAGEHDLERKVLHMIHSRDGKLYYFDGDNYWRMFLFVRDSVTYEKLNCDLSFDVGVTFGNFQTLLSDLPEGSLRETIPDFHNMVLRIVQFESAVADDRVKRLSSVEDIVDTLLLRADDMCRANKLNAQRLLPKRVTHCDTKINNLLFDITDKPLCVIDLDTTMPGYVLSDFGDFMRTGANTGAEDDLVLEHIDVDMDIFECFARGYIGSALFLTPVERENLPFGACMMTYMQTIRFLTDYLDGDRYYKIHHPEHNLQRTKAQFRLLQCLESRQQQMMDFIGAV